MAPAAPRAAAAPAAQSAAPGRAACSESRRVPPARAHPGEAGHRQSPACTHKAGRQAVMAQPVPGWWAAKGGEQASRLVQWVLLRWRCAALSDERCRMSTRHNAATHRASSSTSRSTHSARMLDTSRPSPPSSPASAESAAATVRASISCAGREGRGDTAGSPYHPVWGCTKAAGSVGGDEQCWAGAACRGSSLAARDSASPLRHAVCDPRCTNQGPLPYRLTQLMCFRF